MLLPVEIARFNRPQRRLVSVALILASRRTAVSCYGALRSPDFPPADCSADDRLEKFRSQGMHFTRFIAAFQARTDFHPHRPLPRNFDYPLAITIGFIYIFVHLPRSPAKQSCKRHNDINPTSQSSLLEKRKLFKNPCSQAELNKIVPFGFSLQRQKMVFFLPSK